MRNHQLTKGENCNSYDRGSISYTVSYKSIGKWKINFLKNSKDINSSRKKAVLVISKHVRRCLNLQKNEIR